MAESFSNAMINRSLRTVKTFLVDANVITSQQYDAMLNQLPASAAASSARALPAAPVQELAQLNMKKQQPEPDKKNGNIGYYTSNNDVANGPPPAYPTPPAAPAGPMMLAYATAMYQYNAQDAGDLALMPNDKIVVHEYMNNEWWKGLNERTGQEGIFPASYVRREEKGLMPTPAPGPPAPSNYGNMPLDVSQGASHNNNNTPQEPGKGGEMGKKFGKKLGNAAIFGAGASIGGKIVNGIF